MKVLSCAAITLAVMVSFSHAWGQGLEDSTHKLESQTEKQVRIDALNRVARFALTGAYVRARTAGSGQDALNALTPANIPPATVGAKLDGNAKTDLILLLSTQQLLSLFIRDTDSAFVALGTSEVTMITVDQGNVMHNDDIRNGWDKLNTWMSALGPILAATGTSLAVLGSGDDTAKYTGVGVGLVGVIGLVSSVIGKAVKGNNEDSARSKGASQARDYAQRASDIAGTLALSRRVLDDVNLQVRLLKDVLQKVEQRSKNLKKLNGEGAALAAQIGAFDPNQPPSYKRADVVLYTKKILSETSSLPLLSGFVEDYLQRLITLDQQYIEANYGSAITDVIKKNQAAVMEFKVKFENTITKDFHANLVIFITNVQQWQAMAEAGQ